MCDELSTFRSTFILFASALDVSSLSPAEASALLADLVAVIDSASALEALLAVQAASGEDWRAGGWRSAADELADRTGASVSAARDALTAGRRMAAFPEVGRAALSGELSPAKAALVAAAAEVAPEAVAGLLEHAKGAPLASLRDEVAKVRAAAQPDREARRRELRKRRSLRSWTDVDGAWQLRATGCPEDGAQVMAVISPRADARFDEARHHGERGAPAAYAYCDDLRGDHGPGLTLTPTGRLCAFESICRLGAVTAAGA